MNLEQIVKPLITWYLQNKRDLPWRQDVTAYKVWVSEIMLQQTRVEAVKEYYQRFMMEIPTIKELANIEEDRLLSLWQGLGYYNRARNMQKAAQIIETKYQGIFPSNYLDILSLPGIGSYTAGAICSLAFHRPIPAVDGNVLRVLSRIMASFDDITKLSTKKKIEQSLRSILTSDMVSNFNQGLMELGALVCLPNGAPKCSICPLRSLCLSYKQNLVSKLPVKSAKKPRRKLEKTILVLRHQDRYAIRKREDRGLLASMYEFPNIDGHSDVDEIKKLLVNQKIEVQQIKSLPSSKHIFTHLEWSMIGYEIVCFKPNSNYLWVTKQELDQYSLPTAFHYYDPRNKND